MSPEKWDRNWSLDSGLIFKRIMDRVIEYYRRIILKIFAKNNVRGKTVLELGCGTADDTAWIMKTFGYKEALVVDFSPQALEKATTNKSELLIKPLNTDILKLHLAKKFDLVHSGFVIEHFYGKKREEIIKKHAEFVKGDGFVFMQVPGKTLLSWLYSKTVNKINGIEELLYSKSELISLVKKANLEIVELVSLFGGSVFFVLARTNRGN